MDAILDDGHDGKTIMGGFVRIVLLQHTMRPASWPAVTKTNAERSRWETAPRKSLMITYTRELTVAWGESDPFGLVYYPMMFTWFNEAEHDLLRELGFSTNRLIKESRTAFVMGDIKFRFLGPASFGDRVLTTIHLAKLGTASLHWDCTAVHKASGAPITKGRAIRIHSQFQDDGSLKAVPVPAEIRESLGRDVVLGAVG
jgi:YbgC/YbaW family acyl-CoA thioester hydrolase